MQSCITDACLLTGYGAMRSVIAAYEKAITYLFSDDPWHKFAPALSKAPPGARLFSDESRAASDSITS